MKTLAFRLENSLSGTCYTKLYFTLLLVRQPITKQERTQLLDHKIIKSNNFPRLWSMHLLLILSVLSSGMVLSQTNADILVSKAVKLCNRGDRKSFNGEVYALHKNGQA